MEGNVQSPRMSNTEEITLKFEDLHAKYKTQWLRLLENFEAKKGEREGFRAKLQQVQRNIESLPPNTLSLRSTRHESIDPNTKYINAPRIEQPSRGARGGKLLDLSVEELLQNFYRYSQTSRERAREFKALLEDVKMVMYYYGCDRYLSEEGISTESEGVQNNSDYGLELERILEKYGKEASLGIEEVHHRAEEDVSSLLLQLKQMGDLYRSLSKAAENVRVGGEALEIDFKSILPGGSYDPRYSEANYEQFNVMRFALQDQLREASKLLQQAIQMGDELRECKREVADISNVIQRKLRLDRSSSMFEIGKHVEGAPQVVRPERSRAMTFRHPLLEPGLSASTPPGLGAIPSFILSASKYQSARPLGNNSIQSLSSKIAHRGAPRPLTQVFIPEGADSRVYFWLQQQGLLEYFDDFLKEGVQFADLAQLNEDTLAKMGIGGASGRRNILNAVKNGVGVGSAVVKKGWMRKKGEVRKKWKKRFFILLDCGILWYFPSETTPRAKGFIDIRQGLKVGADPELHGAKGFPFGLITSKRTYALSCGKETERNEWCKVLSTYFRQ